MKQFCAALILLANTAIAQDSMKISGKIQDPVSDSIEVSYNDNKIAYYPHEYFAQVDKQGNFSIAFPVPKGVYTEASIIHGHKFAEVILHSGDSLTIKATGVLLDSTIHYSGSGSSIQNFMAQHYLDRGLTTKYIVVVKQLIYKEPAEFIVSIEHAKKEETDYLDKHKAELPASFIKYRAAYYQYYNYFFIQQYPQLHEMLRLRKYTDTIPEGNYAVIKELPYAFDDAMLQLPPYMLYLTGIFDIKLKAAGMSYYRNDSAKMLAVEDSVNALAYKLLPDKSGEYFIAQNIYGRTKNQPVARTKQQFSKFKKRWPKSEYLPLMEQQLAIAERLAPGQLAPDINITTADGRHMKLSDLRGKVVYLTFWATWCKQCVGEIINERKMKSLTKTEPLEFVYVSIDEDTTAENKVINKYKFEGLFTHAEGGWNAKEIQQYGVQSLPAYFLIDKEGKIAVQNPYTPMQPVELVLQIGQLLK